MRKVIGEDFMKEENLYLVNLMKYILEKKMSQNNRYKNVILLFFY